MLRSSCIIVFLLFIVANLLCLVTSAAVVIDSAAGSASGDNTRQAFYTKWNSEKASKDFDYRNTVEGLDKVKPQTSFNFEAFGDVIKLLVWILATIVLFAIIYMVVTNIVLPQWGRKSVVSAIETDGEQAEMENWQLLFQQAEAAGDFRLMIRYSFIGVLDVLRSRELINYKSDKTNYEYYTEIGHPAYKKQFRKLANTYEYAWYGAYAVSETTMRTYMENYKNLTQQLTR